MAGTDLGDVIVPDVDATLVAAHNEKEFASGTFKKTFGCHPLAVWCDNTQEMPAAILRTGRAGSNTAVDHITVLGETIAQVPAAHRTKLLVRCDGAGASHDLVEWLTGAYAAPRCIAEHREREARSAPELHADDGPESPSLRGRRTPGHHPLTTPGRRHALG